MPKELYCIEHEEMVQTFHSPKSDLQHTGWAMTDEWGDMYWCDFDMGWATCPPPEFDLQAYIEENGQPPAVLLEDFNPYDYEVDTDQIVEVRL